MVRGREIKALRERWVRVSKIKGLVGASHEIHERSDGCQP